MPFIHLSITKELEKEQKCDIADSIAKLVSGIPGKPYERTMVRIDDQCEIYRAGKLAECAYLQTHFQDPVPYEMQKNYIESLYTLFKEKLNMDIPQIYMSMINLETWGSRGTLNRY